MDKDPQEEKWMWLMQERSRSGFLSGLRAAGEIAPRDEWPVEMQTVLWVWGQQQVLRRQWWRAEQWKVRCLERYGCLLKVTQHSLVNTDSPSVVEDA